MKPSWINLTIEQREEFQRILRTVGWRILLGSELPRVLPEGLHSRSRSTLVFSQPTLTGGTHLIVSANRVDSPAKTIEIEPLGLIVRPTATGPIGVFVYDGQRRAGRLEWPPAQFWKEVSRCGIVSKLLEGTEVQLPKRHRRAVEEVIRQVRSREDSTTSSSSDQRTLSGASARTSSDGGMVGPSALAVSRLITSSNLVGCSKKVAEAGGKVLGMGVGVMRMEDWRMALHAAADATNGKPVPVLVGATFVESARLRRPLDPEESGYLVAPIAFYRVPGPAIPLPYDLGDEAPATFGKSR